VISPLPQIRYRAVSMELAAYLDGCHVEMHIASPTKEAARSRLLQKESVDCE
jgi:hypothetical protein